MAGDWIPITVDLPKRREVALISETTGMSRQEVVGHLIDFWGWVSNETEDGLLRDVSVATLVTQLCHDSSFISALMRVGWLTESPHGLVVSNFQRWLSNGAKARLGHALRQKIYRHEKARNVATNVATDVATKAPPEKRREEKRLLSKESNKEYCSEPPTAAAEQSILEFPVVGKNGQTWGLQVETVRKLAEAFPGVDILAEARKASAWCEANRAKRKTPRGMNAFLYGWMDRAQNRGGGATRVWDRAAGSLPADDDRLKKARENLRREFATK